MTNRRLASVMPLVFAVALVACSSTDTNPTSVTSVPAPTEHDMSKMTSTTAVP
jgi:curli biogenesis system outer membrane secretion channel CsgG